MRSITVGILYLVLFSLVHASERFEDGYRTGVEYSTQTLQNDMNLVLVHDPLSIAAKVVLVVESGSALDGSILGQAHLLEHMLFQGSKKYPDPKGFNQFVSRSGGYTNAYTDPDYTLYYMVMNKSALHEGLDRLGSIMVNPKLDKLAINEEKKSVHEEYLLSKNQDGFIARDMLAKMLYPDSAHGIFFAGSIESLKKSNQKTIRDFFNKYYTANKMTLLVSSSYDLKTMKSWVYKYFNPIKKSDSSVELLPKIRSKKSKFWPTVKVASNQNTEAIKIEFHLPSMWRYYSTNRTIEFLIDTISRRGPGGLDHQLKEKGWSSGLFAYSTEKPLYGSFTIYVDLTNEGKLHIEEILGSIEAYLNYLRLNIPADHVYKTYRQASEHQRRSATGPVPLSQLKFMAIMTRHSSLKGLVAPMLEDLDVADYKRILSFLTKDNSAVLIFDPKFKGDQQLLYYDTTFTKMPMISKKSTLSFSPKKKNPFVGKQNHLSSRKSCYRLPEVTRDLLEKKFNEPIKGSESICVDKAIKGEKFDVIKRLGLWSSRSLKFPYGVVNVYSGPVKGTGDSIIRLLLHKEMQSEKDALLASMVKEWIELRVYSKNYQALDAGYYFNFESDQKGLMIEARGPSEYLIDVVKELFEILGQPLTDQDFNSLTEYSINNQVASGMQTGRYHLPRLKEALFYPYAMTPDTRINSIKKLTKGDINQYINFIINQAYLSGVLFIDEDVDSVYSRLSTLFSNLKNRTKVQSTECSYLPDYGQSIEVKFSSRKESGYLNYSVPKTNEPINHSVPACHFQILSQIIGPDFYDKLRTQKQLGYIATFGDTSKFMFFPATYAVVVSGRHDAYHLEKAVGDFMGKIPATIKSISPDEFTTIKSSMLSNYMSMPTLNTQAKIEFNRSFVKGYVGFDQRYAYVKRLSKEKWVEALLKSNKGRGVVSLLADASIHADELSSIKSYHAKSVKRCIVID